jgi:imidazole glycerol-phosphate synthase subunit HisF
MIKHRLIATLLVNNGVVVQTRKFKRTNMVGNAFTAVDFFNGWTVDEICVLEISNDTSHLAGFAEIIDGLSRRCFVPLSVGGKVAKLDDVHRYIRAGADKVVVNSAAAENPALITEISRAYGKQCVVVSIDARPDASMPSGYRVVIDNARRDTDRDACEWAREAAEAGAGELLVNSVEHDGDKRGYDLPLLKIVSGAVPIPVIAMGGVGQWSDLVDGIRKGGADAAAAGNIFHYSEHSTKKAKEFMLASGLPMRGSTFYKLTTPRRVRYNPFQGGAARQA